MNFRFNKSHKYTHNKGYKQTHTHTQNMKRIILDEIVKLIYCKFLLR